MNIANYFTQWVNKNPNNYCLNIDNKFYTYNEIDLLSSLVANTIQNAHSNNNFVGFYASRSVTAFISILGILKANRAYIPLNPKFPESRNKLILSISETNVLIIGSECLDKIEALLEKVDRKFTLIFPDTNRKAIDNLNLPENHVIITKESLSTDVSSQRESEENDYAYMLFTSGSTGIPKGVPISHKNVSSYINYMGERYEDISVSDRFTNTFDLTFDLSVHDMFLCWSKGACLFCIPEALLLAPAKYIKEKKITIWFSVPSTANIMNKLRMLKEANFPDLKYSLFCGEALSFNLAKKWQEAAPNSILENIYGPTEATIGITHYRWNKEEIKINKEYKNILSIGKVFDGQDYLILNENNVPVETEEIGQLFLSGSQVTDKYWQDEEKTKTSFVKHSALNDKLWYKTGDLVWEDNNRDLFFVSRIDQQVKIQGHRVELLEIDNVIRSEFEIDEIISLVYSQTEETEKKIFTFVSCNQTLTKSQILSYCTKNLPMYMIPEDILFVNNFPLNNNGKIDRNKLIELYIK